MWKHNASFIPTNTFSPVLLDSGWSLLAWCTPGGLLQDRVWEVGCQEVCGWDCGDREAEQSPNKALEMPQAGSPG